MKRPLIVLSLAGAFFGTTATVAVASWLATGVGDARSSAGSLSNPGTPSVASNGNNNDLSWTAASLTGGGTVGYQVQRSGDGGATWVDVGNDCGSQATPITARSCSDVNIAAGTYVYRVIARYKSWLRGTSGASVPVASTVTIVSATPSTLGAADPSTVIRWRANLNDAYKVRIGGDDCGAGIVAAAGSGTYLTQPGSMDTTILRSELADGPNIVRVCVGSSSTVTTVIKTVVGIAPSAPTAVALSNGLGANNAWVNNTNKSSVNIKVSLPSTSSPTDTVRLTVSDGTRTVTAPTQSGIAGVGEVNFSGLDLAGLSDSATGLTATAWVTNSAGTSANTTGNVLKDTAAPAAPSLSINNNSANANDKALSGSLTKTPSETAYTGSLLVTSTYVSGTGTCSIGGALAINTSTGAWSGLTAVFSSRPLTCKIAVTQRDLAGNSGTATELNAVRT